MGTFSTASRSPVPGAAGRSLLALDLEKQKLEDTRDAQAAKVIQAARVKSLSQDLLGLEDSGQQSITNWAKANQVSASELTELKPVIDQISKPETFIDKENEGATWQESSKTGKRINVVEKKASTDFSPIHKDQYGREYQIGPNKKRAYLPAMSDTDGEYGPVQTDQYGRDYQIGPNKKRAYLPALTDRDSKGDKVAPFYKAMTSEIFKMYSSDNLEPSASVRSNINRAISRTETRVNSIAGKLGISQEKALPVAMAELRKETILAEDVRDSFPVANSGNFKNNKTEVTLTARSMVNNNVPTHIIGEALIAKGWSDAEVNEIIDTASTLITARVAGIDMAKLQRKIPKQGASVVVNGKIWTRSGDYLVNQSGQKVVINGG